MRLVIATKNKHKLQEIKAILGDIPGYEIVAMDNLPDIEEDQDTFVGNATKKALETAKILGEICVADDSGLEVAALGGAPGVYSARYAGPGATSKQLCEKLLKEMQNIPKEKRKARFRTVVVMASPEKVLHITEGEVEGEITTEMRGTNGFGYDPVFFYPPLQKTFAEMSEEMKNSLSHRARAFVKLKEKLNNNSRPF